MKRNRLILICLGGIVLAIWGCSRVETGPQTVRLAVSDHGFSPLRVEARRGELLTLLVTRESAASCAKEIIIPAVGIRDSLPLRGEVRISFRPERRGELRYTCCDDMAGGTIVVR